MHTTSNLKLKKPEGTDVVNIEDINSNMDKLDVEVAKKASHSTDGRMSKEDKTKLDGIASGANKYVHPSTHSIDMISETSSKKVMTSTERSKLAGIASGANKYVHPSKHSAGVITQDSSHRFVTDSEKSSWSSKADGKHTHDDRYYTESEVNSKLSKIDTSITHIKNDVSSNKNKISDSTYKSAGGSTNSISVSKTGFVLSTGHFVDFKARYTNTGNVNLLVNSYSYKDLKNADGTELSAGDIEANNYYRAIWNGSFFVLASKGGLMKKFFGDGSDGVLNTTKDIKISSDYGGAGDTIVKEYTSITINSGHTLTVSNPCQGLILYSQGDVTINGVLSMTKKAGIASNAQIPPLLITKFDANNGIKALQTLTNSLKLMTGGAGGNGGDGRDSNGGNGGVGRINLGGFGGGGAGGNASLNRGGNGGDIEFAELGGGIGGDFPNVYLGDRNADIEMLGIHGTCGAGGSGSLSLETDDNSGAYAFPAYGGKCQGGGGGGGGGACRVENTKDTVSADNGGYGEYAGGFVAIIARGNITIGSNGKIEANGGSGGTGGSGSRGNDHPITHPNMIDGSGGGGAGGGVIALYYQCSYTNNGTIEVNGGLGGIGYKNGVAGSLGTIYTQQL